MTNLYDILQSAQGGQAMENLARQFQLTQQQTQAAVEALLPAFSMGLKRQASDPTAMPSLFNMLGGANLEAFQNPMAAFGGMGQTQGNEVLGTLFGSKEASRAVADQAAALSGVGPAVLKAMLPVIAAMLMGGLQKTAASQPGLQDIFSQMMGGLFGGQAAPAPAPAPQVQPNPYAGGLLGAILGSLLQQGAQQAQSAPTPQPQPQQAPPPEEVFGQMFETGRQMQQAHLDSLEAIFNTFLSKK